MENKGIIKLENNVGKRDKGKSFGVLEHIIHFVLGVMFGTAKIIGGLSPFGVGFVASCGDTVLSISAMLGTITGYIFSCGFIAGLKYVSASLLVFTASHMLKKWPLSKNCMFASGTAFFVMAVFSIACNLMPEPIVQNVMLCVCDAVLAGISAHFLKISALWNKGRHCHVINENGENTVSVIIMLSVFLVSLNSLKLFEQVSVGRTVACLLVVLCSYKGKSEIGCAFGTALGLAMDIGEGIFFFCSLYSILGLASGMFAKYGKLPFTVTAVLTCGIVSAFRLDSVAVPGCLYEMFIASVVFVLMPDRLINRIELLIPSVNGGYGEKKTKEYIIKRLQRASEAFTALYDTVRDAVGIDRNDSDIAAVFDATAERVCRNCRNSRKCWITEYNSTLDALNGMTDKMLAEGEISVTDMPEYFVERCSEMEDFIDAVNDELRGLRYRRQYRAKLFNNQKAAFGQYADMASILSCFADDLHNTFGREPRLEDKLGKYLKVRGINGDVAVYKGTEGRLRAEISSTALIKMRKSRDWLNELSAVMGKRLCTGESSNGYTVIMEAEPLAASVGLASINKRASKYSGDNSSYFKTDEGVLYVILSDGMGTGCEAAKYSRNAISVLENFLKSGIAAETAVRILNDLMLLKNQNETECCTVDIISIDLFTGKSAVFKYGAAASYLKRDEEVERISGTSMAAGLGFPPEDSPDIFRVGMHTGEFAVMVSDGVTSGGCDDWLFELLEKYAGSDPKELAGMIVKSAVELYGDQDDMTAFVIYVTDRK